MSNNVQDAPLMSRSDIRVEAWRAVLEKADRILSSQPVTVQVTGDDGQGTLADVPAWSDGVNIHLNGKMLRESIARQRDPLASVLRLKGLNYHELCHVLYTPRMTDEFPKRVVARASDSGDKTWWYAFNALEDQRIETWFAATYITSKRYFESIILEWIIREGNAEAAILVYGRKYLSPRIRVQAGRVFVKKYGKALYDEFKTVIDDYITLELPTQDVKAMNLLIKFYDLLKKMQGAHSAPLPPLVIMDNGMHDGVPSKGGASVSRTGRVMVKAARRAAQQASEVIEDAIDADLEEEARRDEQDAKGKGGADQGGDAKAGQADGDESQDGSGGAQGQGDNATGQGGGGAADTGVGDHHVANEADLRQEMKDLVKQAREDNNDVKNDPKVQEEAERILDAVRARELQGAIDAAGEKFRRAATRPPTEAGQIASRKVKNTVRRIRAEAEPETLRRQHTGRVDIRRLVSRQPQEIDVFTQWDMGSEEETGVEVVLLVDVSGSMSGRTTETSEATWAMKRAFDALDIRTTVMLYDTKHQIVWQPSERAQPGKVPQMTSGGGTDPTSGLIQAGRVLHQSKAPNKVLITLTDGQWGGTESERLRIMRGLHKMGVITMLLGFGGAYERYGKHGHLDGHDLDTMADLPRVATKLVAQIMRNAIWSV